MIGRYQGSGTERSDARDGTAVPVLALPTQLLDELFDTLVNALQQLPELSKQGPGRELYLGHALLQLLARLDDAGTTLEQSPELLGLAALRLEWS